MKRESLNLTALHIREDGFDKRDITPDGKRRPAERLRID
jgi:hypothetical protein